MQSEHRHHSVPQLVFGLIIVTIGVLLTLDTLGIADAEHALRYWPAALIAIGLAKVWQSGEGRGGTLGGTLLTIVGAALLLESVFMVDVQLRALWPLLIVLVGAALVWRSMVGRQAPAGEANTTLTALAVLGGVSRGNNSRTFRGGDLTAVMGGCEIDLRQAAIDGEAVIDVFALWGGIELRVPEDWTVVVRVTPLLGGVEDKTRPPQGLSSHRLVVRGFVIMAGVEIKN